MVQAKKAGEQPTPINNCPSINHDGQREGHQHRLAQAIQIHAHAHEQLCNAKRQPEQARKSAQRLGRQAKVGAQPIRNDGGDGAKSLAQRKAGQQSQQHGPQLFLQGCVGGRSGWQRGIRRWVERHSTDNQAALLLQKELLVHASRALAAKNAANAHVYYRADRL